MSKETRTIREHGRLIYSSFFVEWVGTTNFNGRVIDLVADEMTLGCSSTWLDILNSIEPEQQLHAPCTAHPEP